MKALRYIFLLALSLTLLTCGEQRFNVLLQQVDLLIDNRPDSPWALLTTVDSADMQHQLRSLFRRFHWESIAAFPDGIDVLGIFLN